MPVIQRTVDENPFSREYEMSLNFPNPSRSYDASHHCVNFWGYDNAREIAFVVTRSVISNLSPSVGADEPAVLAAFDRHREQILTLARGLYLGGPQNRYTIS
ncbi:Protein of unknown function [Burkholderia sp. WP9]|jgi:hypothetical protein|nr:Protein of unknown function [Burkholderia sp. WP9]